MALYRRSNKSVYIVIINSISRNSNVIYSSLNAYMCLREDILTCFISERTFLASSICENRIHTEKEHTLNKEMQNEVKIIINIQQVNERLKSIALV